MKKYTQEEFDNFKTDEYGYKICPTGDYTDIKNFCEWCDFGDYSTFGERCDFGDYCHFGDDCCFCEWCFFGEWCSFGAGCSFGERCNFENGRVVNGIYFACDRIGSKKRKTYFFKGDNGYFVRAGCFFGTFDEFIERVHQVHAVTKYEKEYELAIELAKVVMG